MITIAIVPREKNIYMYVFFFPRNETVRRAPLQDARIARIPRPGHTERKSPEPEPGRYKKSRIDVRYEIDGDRHQQRHQTDNPGIDAAEPVRVGERNRREKGGNDPEQEGTRAHGAGPQEVRLGEGGEVEVEQKAQVELEEPVQVALLGPGQEEQEPRSVQGEIAGEGRREGAARQEQAVEEQVAAETV